MEIRILLTYCLGFLVALAAYLSKNLKTLVCQSGLFRRGNGETICAVMADGPGQQGPDKSKVQRGKPEMFDLLDEFPDILTPNFHKKENKHQIEHYIKTEGHPVFARPRRLDQAKLDAARAEFAELERLGIIRRSRLAVVQSTTCRP